jgi:hypothetical protein
VEHLFATCYLFIDFGIQRERTLNLDYVDDVKMTAVVSDNVSCP